MLKSLFLWALSAVSIHAFGDGVFAPEPATGPPVLSAAYPVAGKPVLKIGRLKVRDVGEVTLFASQEQGHIVIKAMDSGKSQIGRAETLAGLGDTIVYIKSPRGLVKLLVHWTS